MPQQDRIDDLRSKVASIQAEVDETEGEIEALHDTIAKKGTHLATLLVKLGAFQEAFAIVSPQAEVSEPQEIQSEPPQSKRRMRLGAKKRVVFLLIASGDYPNSEAIIGFLEEQRSDIDARYVREILRAGVADGDFSGSPEGFVSITDSGMELVENAPEPSDWVKYSGYFNDAGEENGAPNLGAPETEKVTAFSEDSLEDILG